jgi:hypothetical protein
MRLFNVERAVKTHMLLNDWAVRTANSWLDTAQLLAFGSDAATWGEWLRLQQAFAQRLIQHNQTWLQGWGEWVQQREQLRSANTMSKRIEQECDLMGQFGLWIGDQVTNFSMLMENTQVSYAYWLNEKRHPESVTAPNAPCRIDCAAVMIDA